jgi:hypothetical protein
MSALIDWLSPQIGCLVATSMDNTYRTATLWYRALRGSSRLGGALGRHSNAEEYDPHAAMIPIICRWATNTGPV